MSDFEDSDETLDARHYAEKIIRDSTWQLSWDRIAEEHPSGEILTQAGCDKVVEALGTARITITWDEQ